MTSMYEHLEREADRNAALSEELVCLCAERDALRAERYNLLYDRDNALRNAEMYLAWFRELMEKYNAVCEERDQYKVELEALI